MASPPNKISALSSLLGMEDKVDYGSVTSVQVEERAMSQSPVLEDKPLSAPNLSSDVDTPLAQRVASASDEAIITNPLDESQARVIQQEEHALRQAHISHTLKAHRDYVFTPPSMEERLRQVGDQSLVS